MPTLFRLVTTILLICAVVYGIMAALVYFVQPTQRELSVDVPVRPSAESDAIESDASGSDAGDGEADSAEPDPQEAPDTGNGR